MKKYTIGFILILLLASACTAVRPAAEADDSLRLYYPTYERSGSRNSALDTEPLKNAGDSPEGILKRLMKPPSGAELAPLFSNDVKLVSLQISDGLAIIVFSKEYNDVAGLNRVLAEASITLTLCQLDGIDSVAVRSETESPLSVKLLSSSDFVLDNLSLRLIERELPLYFTDESKRYLIRESRTIILRENESAERYVVDELFSGPSQSSGTFSSLPPNISLLSVVPEGGVCFVNFPRAFWDNIPSSAEEQRAVLCCLVNSLTELQGSDVSGVQLLLEGVPQQYYGAFSVSEPLKADMFSVAPSPQFPEDKITCLYYPSAYEGIYVKIPVYFSNYENSSLELLALEAMFSNGPPIGLDALIPPNLVLKNFTTQEQTFVVELLYPLSPDSLTEVLHCLTLTLTHRYNSMDVRFYVNGKPVFESPMKRDAEGVLP